MGEKIDRVLANSNATQDEIRSAISEAVEEDGIDLNDVARRTGLPGNTLKAWMNGSLRGTSDLVWKSARMFLKSRAA